jgi:hypothetical protein
VNARTNPHWHYVQNDRRIHGRTLWYSAPLILHVPAADLSAEQSQEGEFPEGDGSVLGSSSTVAPGTAPPTAATTAAATAAATAGATAAATAGATAAVTAAATAAATIAATTAATSAAAAAGSADDSATQEPTVAQEGWPYDGSDSSTKETAAVLPLWLWVGVIVAGGALTIGAGCWYKRRGSMVRYTTTITAARLSCTSAGAVVLQQLCSCCDCGSRTSCAITVAQLCTNTCVCHLVYLVLCDVY